MYYVITLVVFVLAGIPIAFVIGLIPFIKWALYGGIPTQIFSQRMFSGATIYLLLAIPFFILAGNLMNSGGLTKRIVRFSRIFVGRVRGGLGMVNVISSMFFGGITGSANADTAAIGSVLIPAMVEDGYDPEFSAAITVTSSTIGPIIPPSISFILYAVMSGESVGALFLAGAVPGILIGVALLIITYFISRKRNYPRGTGVSWREAIESAREGIWALIMPIIILGGILTGLFTPTEAAGIAVAYSFVVGFFIYKELTWQKVIEIAFDSAKLSAGLLLIVSMASVLAWVLSAEQLPTRLAQAVVQLTNNKWVVLLLINIIMLILGTVLEPTSNLIILTPMFVSLANQFGINLVHLGVIMVLNLTIGLITPPVGMCLFTACGIAKISVERLLTNGLAPLLLTVIVVLLLVTYIPAISLFLPGLIGG